MRNRFELLTGTILALTFALPPGASAQSPSVRQAPPPAPFQFGTREHVLPPPNAAIIRREPAHETPRSPMRDSAREAQASVPAPETPSAAPAAAPAPVPAPAPAAVAPPSADKGPINSMLDRVFGASDAQITEKLKEIAAARRMDSLLPREADRKAAEAFYKARNYAPIWIKDGGLTPRAKAAITRLGNAGADALDPAEYPVPSFNGGAHELAEDDIKLTSALLHYARHLQTGRIAPTRVSVEVDYGIKPPEPMDYLRRLADASDIDATLESFNPPHAGFKALKKQLAALKANASADEDTGRIPNGPAVQPGQKDPRVPALRAKLGVAGKDGDLTYDKALVAAVNRVQAKADIKGKGILDDKAVALINGPKPSQMIHTIEANMERWRWLPRELGRTYVMVNVPDFTLKVVKDNEIVWRTKIVSGKPETPTPLTSASMQTIVVNPSWYVPQSIIQNELLPQYDRDPKIFERMGLEVKRGPDGNINVVQPPGAANALGHIKFNFPNKYQVYLHDTPEKRLFAHERRAFSHGCMRVEDPTKFGEVMLSLAMAGPTPDSRTLLAMYGKEEKTYTLQQQPRVHLTYQTAYVDDAGKLVIREDLYGFDQRIRTILNSDERKIADVPPPLDKQREAALTTAKSNQEILRRVERGTASNPLQFFERLFR
ncbi:MAG: L,D-transpeptidase family protein [Pseudolabrys sp.]|nr:L,D-transpeptidase family protein [Pseudolabrys sp.]